MLFNCKNVLWTLSISVSMGLVPICLLLAQRKALVHSTTQLPITYLSTEISIRVSVPESTEYRVMYNIHSIICLCTHAGDANQVPWVSQECLEEVGIVQLRLSVSSLHLHRVGRCANIISPLYCVAILIISHNYYTVTAVSQIISHECPVKYLCKLGGLPIPPKRKKDEKKKKQNKTNNIL